MTKSFLKFSTAFSVIIALAASAPLIAQTEEVTQAQATSEVAEVPEVVEETPEASADVPAVEEPPVVEPLKRWAT